MKPGRVHPRWLGAMLLSGAGGLGLQLTWTRQLSLLVGHELPALLSVLTAFFGGLALGGWAWEKLLNRARFQSHWPACLEVTIGAWALVSVVVLGPVASGVAGLLPANTTGAAQFLVTLPAVWLLLLPATVPMGATVPAVLRGLSDGASNSGRGLALLYAANTAGGVVGTWGAVLWMQPHFGLRATVMACALCHFLAAVLLWRSVPQPVSTTPTPGGTIRGTWPVRGHLLTTGCLGIGLEITANRALAPVLEGTVYTHAAILGVFLIATAIGSALERARPADSAAGPLGWLAITTVAAGHALIHVREWHEFVRLHLPPGPFGLFLTESLIALSVLGPPCLCMGSCLVRLLAEAQRTGMGTGTALAWNTVGAALAGPLMGTVLLPILGLRPLVWLVAAGYGISTTLHRGAAGRTRSAMVWLAIVLLGLGLPDTLGIPDAAPGTRWVKWIHGASESVGIAQSTDGNRVLSVQGRFTMGGTASTNAAARQLLLPMMWHPAPQRALLLGVGTGISLGATAVDPALKAVGVELLPEVMDLQEWFRPHNTPSTGSLCLAGDARRFLRQSRDRYDLIVGDLFHPARDGAGALYTREHFAAMRDHLAAGGIAVQWLPLYQLDAAVLRSIVGAFLAEFPETHAWLLRPNLDTPVLGLAARNGPWRIHETDFTNRVARSGPMRSRLQAAGLASGESVWGSWLAGPRSLATFAAGAAPSTDDRPSVVFQAPHLDFTATNRSGRLLLEIIDRFAGEGSEFPFADAGGGWGRRLADYRASRDAFLHGLAEDDLGNRAEAEASFLRSARLSPDFTLGYSHLLTRAMLRSQSDPAGTRRLLELLREARPEQPVAGQLLDRLDPTHRRPPAR